MRMMPTRTLGKAQPLLVKGRIASVSKTFLAPVKGLNLSVKNTTTDQMWAPILSNFVVAEDTIDCRPGYAPFFSHGDAKPIPTLMPYAGVTPKLLFATNGKLATTGGTLGSGYASDDWGWTTFSNLGDDDYLVMANGHDGVKSWNGIATTITDEVITAPTSMAWFDADLINIVMSHQNRLFMADTANLTVYYLPLQTKSGEVKQLPLQAVFKRGGTIRALYSWSIDGGAGQNSQLVVFTDQNEAAIYQGIDPDTDFSLVGVYKFDSPMSKHSVAQYGGELFVQINTGVVPMSTLMRAEAEQLGTTDKAVLSEFQSVSSKYANVHGWGLYMDYSSGRLICSLPLGAEDRYRQMVRKMPNSIWTSWDNVPAHSWCWLDRKLYFGDDKGNIHIMDPLYLSDNGDPIHTDVQFAWSNFGTPGFIQFKMVRLWYLSDGSPKPYIDLKTDYDTTPPRNRPDVSLTIPGAEWDEADWDSADWASGELTYGQWNGVASKGNAGAVRVSCDVIGCTYKIKMADVLYEQGSIMG